MLIKSAARDLAQALGGPGMAPHLVDPIRFAARVGFPNLDRWQRDVLTTDARQVVMNCSRQLGKSSCVALLATWTALTTAGALILLVAPAVRQASELYRKCRDALGRLGPDAPRTRQESALSLEFANRSRILVIPAAEATVRGFSAVTLLCIDEASRVPDPLYFALRPMLAVSQGRIVLLSTPNGASRFFWAAFTSDEPDWLRVQVTAADCPRIPRAWLAAERARIGHHWYAQEFCGEFVDAQGALYRSSDIEAAISDELEPLFLPGAA